MLLICPYSSMFSELSRKIPFLCNALVSSNQKVIVLVFRTKEQWLFSFEFLFATYRDKKSHIHSLSNPSKEIAINWHKSCEGWRVARLYFLIKLQKKSDTQKGCTHTLTYTHWFIVRVCLPLSVYSYGVQSKWLGQVVQWADIGHYSYLLSVMQDSREGRILSM